MPITRASKSEEEELPKQRALLAVLESELAEAELGLATLSAELAHFDRSCRYRLAERYALLDDLEARIAEAHAASQPADPEVRQRAQTAREKARESTAEVPSPEEAEPAARFKPLEALKSLFRRVVKAVHPDLATSKEDAQRRHELMIAANDAYGGGDELRLRELLRAHEAQVARARHGAAAELIAVRAHVESVRARLVALRREVVALKSGDLHAFMVRAHEASEHGRDLIAEMAAELDEEIRTAEERLAEARGR